MFVCLFILFGILSYLNPSLNDNLQMGIE